MSKFKIIEHTIPGQYIREYPRALADSQEDILSLHVKQYVPLENRGSQTGVTIIAAHANAFVKELYEPLWDELLAKSEEQNWKIHSIWIADVAHQGFSSVQNAALLGNDPSWLDHSRDLLHIINMKRAEMPRPLIGVGHSMGGAQLVNLAYMHPRLLTSIILIDPVIQERTVEIDPTTVNDHNIARLSTFRRTTWPSRAVAAASFRKSAFYKAWDSRTLDRWIEYGLHASPTTSEPDQVTLTTPVSHEVHTFIRPNYPLKDANAKHNPTNRLTHPDVDTALSRTTPFYRPEPVAIFRNLPTLRPSALYIFGGNSDTSNPTWNAAKIDRTGVGIGGSGGAKEGRVKGITFEGVGHLVAMEVPERTAAAAAEWLETEVARWRDEEKVWIEWSRKSLLEKQDITEEWKKWVGGPIQRKGSTSKL